MRPLRWTWHSQDTLSAAASLHRKNSEAAGHSRGAADSLLYSGQGRTRKLRPGGPRSRAIPCSGENIVSHTAGVTGSDSCSAPLPAIEFRHASESPESPESRAPCEGDRWKVVRRGLLTLGLAHVAAIPLLPLHAHAGVATQATSGAPVRQLKENFGVAVLLATEETLVETGKVSQYDLQKEFFKLRQQEFAPLRKANFGGLRALGQQLNVNDVPYFNFQSYIQWKVVARKLPREDERKAFNRAVGRRLLARYFPDISDQALASCRKIGSLAAAIDPAPPSFGFEYTSLGPTDGAHPTSQPHHQSSQHQKQHPGRHHDGWEVFFWEASLGYDGQGIPGEASGAGAVCPQAVRTAVSRILRWLKEINFVQDYSLVWESEEALGSPRDSKSATVTMKLVGPANLEGGLLIKAEEDNFWQRVSSSMLTALFEQLGVEYTVDEYFFREMYKPKSLLEQAVLALGDPLLPIIDDVDVDEVVETWRLSWA